MEYMLAVAFFRESVANRHSLLGMTDRVIFCFICLRNNSFATGQRNCDSSKVTFCVMFSVDLPRSRYSLALYNGGR